MGRCYVALYPSFLVIALCGYVLSYLVALYDAVQFSSAAHSFTCIFAVVPNEAIIGMVIL